MSGSHIYPYWESDKFELDEMILPFKINPNSLES